MSVRAYRMETKNKKISNDNRFYQYTIFEERDMFFNLWHTHELLDLFRYYGFDGTNNDCIGTLEISKESFNEFMSNKENETSNWSDYDLEILEKIKKHFESNDFLSLNCY